MSSLKKVWVRVPASSSNLGPGFDVVGIAFKLYNDVRLSMKTGVSRGESGLTVSVKGEGRDTLPRNGKNLIWKAAKKVLDARGVPAGRTRFHLDLHNRIPLARGLGSSAAACLGGLLAANALCRNIFSKEELLQMALKMEGHPDNVVPSLFGGLSVSMRVGSSVRFIRMNIPKGITAVVCVPDFQLATEKARRVLPKIVSHQDAVFNVSRISLFLASFLQGRFDYLKESMQDKLHEPYRKRLVPGFDRVKDAAYRSGALGVALSGAGPSMLAFVPPSRAGKVGRAMEKGFSGAGIRSRSRTMGFNLKGSEILC